MMSGLLIAMTVLLASADLSAEAATTVEIELLDSRTFAGALVELSADQIVIESATGEETFPTADLLTLRLDRQSTDETKPASVWLELTDGSTLPGTLFSVSGAKASFVATGGSELEVPTRSIAAVRLMQQDEEIARQWGRIRQAETAGDLIVIRKEKAIDYLEGVLGDVSESTVVFKVDGEENSVRRSRVEGLVYYQGRSPEPPELACIVTSANGMRFIAQSAVLAGDRLDLVSVSGIKWSPRLESLEQIDFSAGKVQFLSDLEPESAEWRPYFAVPGADEAIVQFGQPLRDVAREGGPLRLGGKQYEKGLSLLSRTQMVYRLPQRFQWFLAMAGIDDGVGQHGHVRLIIHGDDRQLFDEVLKGGDEPLPLRLDIAGVKRLKIVVDYGQDMDVADHLDLANARVSK